MRESEGKLSMNEANSTLTRYFGKNDSTTVHYYGSGRGVTQFAELFPEHILDDIRPEDKRDSPDLYMKKDNIVYIIEHFEFDCYSSTRKGGSSFRLEEARIEKRIRKVIPTEEGTITRDIIDAKSSYSDYIKNVSALFKKHSRHIPDYIKHLSESNIFKDNDIIKVVFLIEDVSPVGTRAYNRGDGYAGEMVPIVLANCAEFLELMKSDTVVDYVIACSSIDRHDIVWFIDREDIQEYLSNAKDYAHMEFMDWKPNVVSAQIAIPQDKL